jgi:hypothetical protein
VVWQVYGQASDIVLEVEQTMGDNERFLIELAKTTGRPIKDVRHMGRISQIHTEGQSRFLN